MTSYSSFGQIIAIPFDFLGLGLVQFSCCTSVGQGGWPCDRRPSAGAVQAATASSPRPLQSHSRTVGHTSSPARWHCHNHGETREMQQKTEPKTVHFTQCEVEMNELEDWTELRMEGWKEVLLQCCNVCEYDCQCRYQFSLSCANQEESNTNHMQVRVHASCDHAIIHSARQIRSKQSTTRELNFAQTLTSLSAHTLHRMQYFAQMYKLWICCEQHKQKKTKATTKREIQVNAPHRMSSLLGRTEGLPRKVKRAKVKSQKSKVKRTKVKSQKSKE